MFGVSGSVLASGVGVRRCLLSLLTGLGCTLLSSGMLALMSIYEPLFRWCMLHVWQFVFFVIMNIQEPFAGWRMFDIFDAVSG